jgi:hypothetical protein
MPEYVQYAHIAIIAVKKIIKLLLGHHHHHVHTGELGVLPVP